MNTNQEKIETVFDFSAVKDNVESVKNALDDFIDKKVDVKWGGKWFPAELKMIENGSGYVEFENPDYENEWIEERFIRAISTKEAESSRQVSCPTGAFQKQVFKEYVKSFVRDKEVLEFSTEEVSTIRHAAGLSTHATERRDDRYCDRLQEFARCMQTPHDCFYCHQHRYVIRFCISDVEEVKLTVDVDFLRIITVERTIISSCSEEEQQQQQQRRVSRQRQQEKKCDLTALSERPLCEIAAMLATLSKEEHADGESISFLGEETHSEAVFDALQHNCSRVSTVLVFTTTSTLIFSSDLATLVTCYPNKRSFSEWKKSMHGEDKPPLIKNFNRKAAESRTDKIDKERRSKGKPPLLTSAQKSQSARPNSNPSHANKSKPEPKPEVVKGDASKSKSTSHSKTTRRSMNNANKSNKKKS